MPKVVIRMTEEEYLDLAADGRTGICLECQEEADGVEPDAEGYHCDVCGAMQVMGMEQALVSGHIEFE